MELLIASNFYIRSIVEADKRTMYIFTDNTDRDSGSQCISPLSWYSLKFGEDHHYPSVTSAVIRGLDNAFPITTQRWYNSKKKGVEGRWEEEDLEEFKKVIDSDLDWIIKNLENFDRIVFPMGGIFNSKISNISKERVPRLYEYLEGKLKELVSIINSK